MEFEIYTGSSLANALTCFGCPTSFICRTLTPQAVRYYFRFEDINKDAKLKNAIRRLSLEIGKPVLQVDSHKDGSHFCLELQRDVRDYPTYADCYKKLAECKETSVVLGVDENNEILTYPLDKMPHLLVAGATGSGKSVFLNNIILNICHYGGSTGLVLIDPKQVEFAQFERSSHLYCPIITDTHEAINALNNLCDIMDDRYAELRSMGLRDNSKNVFDKIVVVVDELADLMLTSKKEAETPIVRLAQKGRACGIHLILATQRPTVNVVTGLIKANIPCRVAFSMSSVRDSVVLLDHAGANQLLGKGDCLVKLPDRLETIRVQAPFVSQDDIRSTFANSAGNYETTAKFGSRKRKLSFLDKLLNFLGFVKSTPKNHGYTNDFDRNNKNLFSIDEQNRLDCIDDD